MLSYADIQAIKNLMFTYAWHVDERQHEALGEMIIRGVIKGNRGDEGGALRGSEMIRKAYDKNNKVLPNGKAGTMKTFLCVMRVVGAFRRKRYLLNCWVT